MARSKSMLELEVPMIGPNTLRKDSDAVFFVHDEKDKQR
jgi:hypothetical protein